MKVRIHCEIVKDDGSDGIFWHNGERWMREHGKEVRLLEIAPNLEKGYQMQLTEIEERAKVDSAAPPTEEK